MSLPTTLDLNGWDAAQWSEGVYVELVRGVVSVSPGEPDDNRYICDNVIVALRRLTPPGWYPVSQAEITLVGDPEPTIRRPDALVLPEDEPAARRHDASAVALVVEVVSPTSRERDLVSKVTEYAAGVIPAYLVVDPAAATITLRTRPSGRRYQTVRSGSQVTWVIGGVRVVLSAAELLAPRPGLRPRA